MKKNIFIACVAFLLSAQASQAAPAPWGLALNLETKECAGFWAGDEFTGYHLPDGWKAYYPVYDPSGNSHWGKIHTEVGDCSFQIRKEEACCMELGLAFVSDNIGKGQKEKLRDRPMMQDKNYKFRASLLGGGLFLIILLVIALFFLFRYLLTRKRNKKTVVESDKNRPNH
jgi:hypothetical protein